MIQHGDVSRKNVHWTNRTPTALNCALCGHLCTLEECTMDERGRAVHYQCLADKILRQESGPHPRPN
jgi:hypothetical protein